MRGSVRSLAVLWFAGCAHAPPSNVAANSAGLEPILIDRFSSAAGTLQLRTANNGLPGPGQPVDFDRPPFITQSWGPAGEVIRYYNFDVQPTTPAKMYVFYVGEQELTTQHRIVDVIPGQPGYSDFFRVVRVMVPASYVPDELRDAAAILRSGFALVETSGDRAGGWVVLAAPFKVRNVATVNCPIVFVQPR